MARARPAYRRQKARRTLVTCTGKKPRFRTRTLVFSIVSPAETWWLLLYPPGSGRSTVLLRGQQRGGEGGDLVVPDGPEVEEEFPPGQPGHHGGVPASEPFLQRALVDPRPVHGDAR